MDPELRQQALVALAAIVIGVLGWVLPARYNLLRLRRRWANLVSEQTNERIPKAIGVLLVVLGLTILIGTLTVGAFK